MTINYTNKPLNRNMEYRLTVSEDARPLIDAKGMTIPVDVLIICEDTDRKTGEIREFVKIMDTDGYIYTTGSATVLRQVHRAIDYLETAPGWSITAIRPSKGTSKQGHEYQSVEITLGETL